MLIIKKSRLRRASVAKAKLIENGGGDINGGGGGGGGTGGGVIEQTALLLQLRSLLCNEPATAFGDDIEIFVNGVSAGGQFPIDQGQFRDLGAASFEFRGQVVIQIKEDTDPAGELVVDQSLLGLGVQRKFIKVKDDGRYDLFFEVLPLPPGRVIQLRSLLCNEPATSFGDDIEVFVNGISAVGRFPIDQGEFRDLSAFSTNFRGQAVIEFKEDSDPAGELRVDESLVGQGAQRQAVKIKDDGRYDLFFEVK